MYLVHGLAEGRQALYTKIHHAAIDGLTGAEILTVIMDDTAEPRVVEPPPQPWLPPPLPNAAEMLQRGLTSMALQPAELLRTLPQSLPHLMDIPGAANVPGAQAISDLADAALRLVTGSGREGEPHPLVAPRTPLNGPITAHRRFSFGSVPLSDVKAIKDAYGLTVNDVVLTLCTAALRRWLLDHDALPEVPIVVAVPVSTRAAGDHHAEGNQISVMVAQLPTNEADPLKRLLLVQESMVGAKQHFEAVPATILQDLSAVLPTALSGLAARALFRLVTVPGPPFNLYVSNVPGPQLPLYVAGARVLGVYPLSPVTYLTGGLTVTAFSYDGALDFGLIACRELVPDVWNLIDYLRDALAELLELTEASG
jgi:WS/DGAT/MGAT family acyltransferase